MRTFIGSPLRAANCSPGRPRPGGRYAPWPVTSDPSSSSLESLGLLTVRFLAATHRLPPDHLAAMAATVGSEAEVRHVRVWLVDHDQRSLVPMPGGERDGAAFGGAPIDIDSTLAGRVFLSSTPIEVRSDGGFTVWMPLLDGVDRIGVLEAELDVVDLTPAEWQVLHVLASLVAAEVVSRGQYGDVFTRGRRRRGLGVAAA